MAESPVQNEYSRPQGWRFEFAGVCLRDVPDALGPTKFASAKNIRATSTKAVQTRPGYVPLFATGGLPLSDVSSYSTLGTDDLPRFLARDSSNQIWLDNGTLVATLAGTAGYGVMMLPLRPSESPQTWMYITSLGDYQKLSAPDSLNAVTAYKVGIAEPPSQIDASPYTTGYLAFTGSAAAWTPAGVMGGLIDSNRIVDTAGVVFADPLMPARYYVQLGSPAPYGIGEILAINGATANALVEDVFPQAPNMVVKSIRYYAGTTGTCMVSVGQIPTTGDELGALRRNSVIQFNPTLGEYCIVTSVEVGPDGSIAFETSTAGTITPGMTIRGRPSITVIITSVVAGQAILAPIIVSNSTAAGVASASMPLASSPFAVNSGVGTPQSEDYIHISLKVQDPTQLNEIKLLFSVAAGGASFTTDYYYYAVQPSQIAPTVNNSQTQLQTALSELVQSTVPDGTALPDPTSAGVLVWTEILIPISALIRVGGDQTRTLEDCNGVQIVFNVNSAQLLEWGAIWVGHQGQPDIGEDGVAYKYRAVPRNSSTGVRGNPTPPMRYGVKPRRQQVTVTLPSAAYDAQIDTWDIERYGGSVTSYRYIGSAPSSASAFVDNYSDASAQGGDLMQTDNFEPWPTIDVPFRVTSAQATITIVGTWVTISGFTAWPSSITRWLPGTLIQIGSQNAYTLRARPTQISSSSYRFELEEVVSPSIVPTYFWVLEPKVARQILPYTFGPDATGTFFGCGDPLRPGVLSFAKQNNPDSVPDRYNLDLCPPSEPLLGGVIKGAIPIVASTKRWWALYPNFGGIPRFNPIEQSVGRGMISPYANCTDGVLVYFWMRDGIGATDGGPYESLTNTDLYQLFPHEGIDGVNITRNGVTYYAPDYSRLPKFRLSIVKMYIFADYEDTTGTRRTLVFDRRTKGWVPDFYNDPISVHYSTAQQSGALTGSPQKYTTDVLADTNGTVWKEQDCTNDNGVTIKCLVATFEWDGGDQRMQPLFGDSYLDLVPQSQVTVTPMSQGQAVAPATVIAASGAREFDPISVVGGELQKFLGLQIEWEE